MASTNSPVPKEKECELPVAQVKAIMKHSPNVGSIGRDALYMTTKAAEGFIEFICQKAYEVGGRQGVLDYDDLAEVFQSNPELAFFQELLPRRVKYGDYLRLTKEKRKQNKIRDEAVKNQLRHRGKKETEEQAIVRLISNKLYGDYYKQLLSNDVCEDTGTDAFV